MGSSMTRVVLQLWMVLLALLFAGCTTSQLLPYRIRVEFKNELAEATNLTVRCPDLGSHVLPPNGTWEFFVWPGISQSRRTLYFCSFKWADQLHFYGLYLGIHGGPGGCRNCDWVIHRNGPCFIDEDTKHPAICDKWSDEIAAQSPQHR